jgi:hypothetical protein
VTNLPNLDQPGTATTTGATSSFSNLAIEYLSFNDFYVAPDNKIETKFADYQLPLNVKLDILNYYDISRKLNLDPGLDDLNNYGFTKIDNPWTKDAADFYALYAKLDEKQIPILITSDFITYYYQEILKKSFKDIEENVFYDNLWSINKDLYTTAKNRYETHLAAIGSVNDSILEGERLEMAYFAVVLELLKPAANQVADKGTLNDKSKFVASEVDRFYFVPPPYLRDDVLSEVKLIRGAKGKAKSPIFLYDRDYNKDFGVPVDYRGNAKLNNFYLTTKWLNSVFPLNYRDKNCPNCLLDKEDWRLNLIAASYISQDMANLPELKNKWARIYKIMSFFKGLRNDLNYVNYRDSLVALFGADYKISELFGDQNQEALNNLEKLRAKLLTVDFPAIQGSYNKSDPIAKSFLGFKMLAEANSPNEYIFSNLVSPSVGNYSGTTPLSNNITYCAVKNAYQRCNGIALDVINLVSPLVANPYFEENSNYTAYQSAADRLREELTKDALWRTTNYWATLSFIKAMLEVDRDKLPLVNQSDNWRQKSLETAAAAWINFQLPLENFSVLQLFQGQGLSDFARWNENSYVEPNLNLVNELLANNQMLLKMFSALQLDREVNIVAQNLQASTNNLTALKKIIIKELSGEALTADDNQTITDFSKQLKIDSVNIKDRRLTIRPANLKTNLREDLNQLKLLVLIHASGDSKVFSVGPVWNYLESQ